MSVTSNYLVKMMDVAWFKDQQKRAGKTAEDIAREMGRSRSNVSNIYSGHQRMSLAWAKAFAKVLNVPLEDVLDHAGQLDKPIAQRLVPGLADGDVTPFSGSNHERLQVDATAASMGGKNPGVDIWEVRTNALLFEGLRPGDKLLLDTNRSERAHSGDIVIAQQFDRQDGIAEMILRRFEPPVLVAASPDPDKQRVLVMDGRNVVIRGIVIASWRKLGG